jgi:hypothetical protein
VRPRPERGPFKVRALFRAVLIPLALLCVANGLARYEELFGPYIAASAVVVALSLWSHLNGSAAPAGPRRVLAALGLGFVAALLVVAPLEALQPLHSWPRALLAAAPAIVAAWVVDGVSRRAGAPLDDPVSVPRLVMTALAALMVMGAQALDLCPAWPRA